MVDMKYNKHISSVYVTYPYWGNMWGLSFADGILKPCKPDCTIPTACTEKISRIHQIRWERRGMGLIG